METENRTEINEKIKAVKLAEYEAYIDKLNIGSPGFIALNDCVASLELINMVYGYFISEHIYCGPGGACQASIPVDHKERRVVLSSMQWQVALRISDRMASMPGYNEEYGRIFGFIHEARMCLVGMGDEGAISFFRAMIYQKLNPSAKKQKYV